MNDKLKARLDMHFDSLDVDKNNRVDREDFLLRAKNITSARKLEPGSSKHQRIVEHHEFHWRNLHLALGKGSGDSVSRGEWHAIFAHLLADRDSVIAGMKVFADAFFNTLDLDGNGFVSESEHLAYLQSLNADTRGAAACFAKVDADGDGHVTRLDVLKLLTDFYLTDELTPVEFILGSGTAR